MPIFAGDFLTSVLVIFCGDDAAHAGAIELWRQRPGESPDMTLDDGYYGTTADTFEFISRRTSFRRGTGLPGMAWESGLPVFFEDLGKAARLPARRQRPSRSASTAASRCRARCRGDENYVLAFLSALGTPIARRVEVWKPDAGREHLRLDGGFCEAGGLLAAAPEHLGLDRGQGTIGQVFLTGVPGVERQRRPRSRPAGAPRPPSSAWSRCSRCR